MCCVNCHMTSLSKLLSHCIFLLSFCTLFYSPYVPFVFVFVYGLFFFLFLYSVHYVLCVCHFMLRVRLTHLIKRLLDLTQRLPTLLLLYFLFFYFYGFAARAIISWCWCAECTMFLSGRAYMRSCVRTKQSNLILILNLNHDILEELGLDEFSPNVQHQCILGQMKTPDFGSKRQS